MRGHKRVKEEDEDFKPNLNWENSFSSSQHRTSPLRPMKSEEHENSIETFHTTSFEDQRSKIVSIQHPAIKTLNRVDDVVENHLAQIKEEEESDFNYEQDGSDYEDSEKDEEEEFTNKPLENAKQLNKSKGSKRSKFTQKKREYESMRKTLPNAPVGALADLLNFCYKNWLVAENYITQQRSRTRLKNKQKREQEARRRSRAAKQQQQQDRTQANPQVESKNALVTAAEDRIKTLEEERTKSLEEINSLRLKIDKERVRIGQTMALRREDQERIELFKRQIINLRTRNKSLDDDNLRLSNEIRSMKTNLDKAQTEITQLEAIRSLLGHGGQLKETSTGHETKENDVSESIKGENPDAQDEVIRSPYFKTE